MRINQNDHSKSPEQGLRSHKNITSSVAFQLKTQNDRGGQQQQHKSPDANKPDLRGTWRKAQIPYNKLPQVFNPQKQKKKYGGKVKQDMIQNLGKLIENSQYKQTQKYLQPLKPKQQKKQKGQRNLFKPLQKMRDMVSKAHEQIKLSEDISTVKSGPKISQCISLEVIKRGHNTGIIKKMLHIPTMTLACVREQPCMQKDSRNFIRDWTKLWRQKLSAESKNFVQIYQVLYNYPQGAISIFMQYFQSRSLLNLLDLTSTLPESVIYQIFTQLLKTIQLFYNITQLHLGGLSPSQIMFCEGGQIKLSLGLYYHIPIPESFSIYHIKASQGQRQNPFDFGNTMSKFMKNSIQRPLNVQLERSIDVFKLGLIALNCAIGNFENFQQYSVIFNAIRYVFSEQGQKQVELDNACCLLHSQQYLIDLVSSTTTSPPTDQPQPPKKPSKKYLNYLNLLKNRYSPTFIQFLCKCLKLHHSSRPTLPSLSTHTFLTGPPQPTQVHTVQVSLVDMLALGRNWNASMYESETLYKIDHFVGLLRPVLEECGRDVLMELVSGSGSGSGGRDRMYALGKCVGINCEKLGKRIQEEILEILKK